MYRRFRTSINNKSIVLENVRYLSQQKEIPIIKIPKYLENNLGNAIYHEHRKVKENKQKLNKLKTSLNSELLNKRIISWTGDKKLFHYYGQRYDDPNNVPLISKFFLKETSNGQRMIIHNFDGNPSLMKDSLSTQQQRSFESLGLNENLVQSIYDLVNHGKKIQPSTIQFAVIPSILKFKNVIFSAETGSGKTLAYLSPLIQLIQNAKNSVVRRSHKTPFGLIVSPSRELTEQIGNVAKFLSNNTNIGVSTMIGGLPKHQNNSGMDLVVTTIGMIESHLNKGVYSLRNLNHIVLDEADTLLDDSFAYETMELLSKLNINHGQNESDSNQIVDKNEEDDDEEHVLNGTQLICSSATIPPTLDSTIGTLVDMSEDILQISTKNLHTLHPNIKHTFYRVNRYEKDVKLVELLIESRAKKQPMIIFANRSVAVDWLFRFLNEHEFPCTKLTSDMEEEERFQSFRLFQDGQYDILVASDLGSRGLDTSRVKHVINFDCPHFVADYIHRSGRTGRLGTNFIGQVSTLVSFKPDAYMLMELEKSIRLGEPIKTINANIKSQISQKRADKLAITGNAKSLHFKSNSFNVSLLVPLSGSGSDETNSQNVDTKSPSVFWMKALQKDNSSMFGYSVLMHDSDEFGPIILVGAPNYTDFISTSNEPILDNLGEIYHCPIPLKGIFKSKIGCQETNLHEQLKLYDPELFTPDMHFGWNLIPRRKTEEFLTCSYSRTQNIPLMNAEGRMETWKVPNGVCFLFSENNFSKKRDSHLKLIFPMDGEEQFINGVYLGAYGMAGFSAGFSSDEEVVYMGAPGYDNWKGGVASVNLSKYPSFRSRIDYDIEVISWKDMEKDVYLGYSMTTGKFFKDYPEFIVLGAPRRNLTGSIFLFPSNTPSGSIISNDPLLMIINGDQVGEYFGYSLLTLDVNQDGYDDLLVSAPMYSSYQRDYSDEGRVYFYASTGDKKRGFHKKVLLHGDSKPLARFGTAMADLGDINKDGFKDVVIGAPYEDDFKGAIYIYRGTFQGIRDKYHQRISSAEHFTSIGLRGFGCDFSANVDIDSNDYPDIMIGAYLSTNALLLRTRPIIRISPTIQLDKDYVDLNESCSFEDEDFGNVFEKPLACVRLKYCFQITSHYDEYSPKVSLMATLKLDPEFNRAFVIVVDRRFDDQNGQSRYNLARLLNQQFLLVPNKIDYCSNYYLIYLKEMSKIDNLIDPIKFDLDYSIDTSDFKVDDPQEKFHVPILDDETTTNITTDVYLKFCNNTAKDCVANLSLKASFYFDDEPNPKLYPSKSLNELIEGEHRLITLNVQVINSGELAFKTILTIRTEKNVSVVQFDRRCQKVNDKQSEFLIFDCQLMDQLFEMDSVNLTFNLFNVAETEMVPFQIEISHYNQQSSNLKYEVSFKTIKKSEINLKVIPNDSNVKRYPSYKKIFPKTESMIQIERFGPSSINEIVLNFIYPNSYNQHEIISSVQVKGIDNSIKLECDQPRLLPIGQDTSQSMSIYSNYGSGKRLINLNCSNAKIICHLVKCRFGPLKIMPNNKIQVEKVKNHHGSIYFRLNINENITSIQKKFNKYKFTNLTISIDLNASINDTTIVQSGLIKHEQIVLNWIPIYVKDSEQTKWGIFIGTIVGIILLALIILCCYRLNFFERNELLQANRINSNDGYD